MVRSEFEEAAKILSKEKSIRLGRVDCSKEEELKNRFGIDGYPTLKVLRNGKKTYGYSGQAHGNRNNFNLSIQFHEIYSLFKKLLITCGNH